MCKQKIRDLFKSRLLYLRNGLSLILSIMSIYVSTLMPHTQWPVYFFATDTTREKLDMDRFSNLAAKSNAFAYR